VIKKAVSLTLGEREFQSTAQQIVYKLENVFSEILSGRPEV
jgi:hypothetical protein